MYSRLLPDSDNGGWTQAGTFTAVDEGYEDLSDADRIEAAAEGERLELGLPAPSGYNTTADKLRGVFTRQRLLTTGSGNDGCDIEIRTGTTVLDSFSTGNLTGGYLTYTRITDFALTTGQANDLRLSYLATQQGMAAAVGHRLAVADYGMAWNEAGVTSFGDCIWAHYAEVNNVTDLAISLSARTPANGNLLVVFAQNQNGAATFSMVQAGWTEIHDTASFTETMSVCAFYKISDGTETTATVRANSASNEFSGTLFEFDWDGSTPTITEGTGGFFNNASNNTPVVTPPAGNNIIIAGHHIKNVTNATHFAPTRLNPATGFWNQEWMPGWDKVRANMSGLWMCTRVNGSGLHNAFQTTRAAHAKYSFTIVFTVAGAGPQTIPVNQVLEADLAQPVTAAPGVVTVAVNQALESDLAQPVTASQATAIAVNQALESDLAQLVTPAPGVVAIPVNQVLEADLAQPVTAAPGVVTVTVNQALEADLAQPVTASQATVIAVNQALEADLAQAIAAAAVVTVAVNQALESDLAQPVTASQATVIAVNQALEGDLAQPVTAAPGVVVIAVNQALESDLAQAVTAQQGSVIAVNQALESDLAQLVTPAPGVVAIPVNPALEADLAQLVTPAPGPITIAVNQALEADLAQPFTVDQGTVINVGLALEADLAQPFTILTGGTIIAVAQVFEIDTALAINPVAVLVDGETIRRRPEKRVIMRNPEIRTIVHAPNRPIAS